MEVASVGASDRQAHSLKGLVGTESPDAQRGKGGAREARLMVVIWPQSRRTSPYSDFVITATLMDTCTR